MALVTVARPKDVDLAVPPLTPGQPSGMTLRQIVDGYSQWVTKDWARACNVEYRAGPSGPSVSLIAEGGKIWTTGDPRWPVMLATKDGISIKDNPSESEVKAARWAFSAGPWLVRDGKTSDIAAEINKGGYSGFTRGVAKEQAAIGIRPDGAVVHYADMSMTLEQLAAKMLELGCRDAIKLDGGGSLGVVDSNGKVLVGYTIRQVCCALVFRRLVDESLSQDLQPTITEPQKGGDQMLVCIDPGHGGNDPGAIAGDGILEKDVTLRAAERVAEYLKRAGIDVVLTRAGDVDINLQSRCDLANKHRADYFVSIHANAAENTEANGYEMFHWPGSDDGLKLAQKISSAYVIASGLPLRRITGANFHVLRQTTMPAILVELGFMTNKSDMALLAEPAFLDKCALGIAFGILNMRA